MRLINEDDVLEKEQKLRKLIIANPDLPVIFMVNSDVVVDDFYANWLASISSVEVGEYCCYKTRYYDDKNDLEEEYYVDHEDELKNCCFGNDEIDMIIKERTSSWWRKAIIVYVDVPSDEEANDHE